MNFVLDNKEMSALAFGRGREMSRRKAEAPSAQLEYWKPVGKMLRNLPGSVSENNNMEGTTNASSINSQKMLLVTP